MRGLIEGALVGLPLLVIFIIAGAWAVARTGLAPLMRFEKLAMASSTVSLAHRLELDDLPKDLRDMGVAFNAMLDRIDEGVLRLTRVAGDLAHEMRTPIATLIGLSQVTLSQPRSADELRSVMERNIEELERLSATYSGYVVPGPRRRRRFGVARKSRWICVMRRTASRTTCL